MWFFGASRLATAIWAGCFSVAAALMAFALMAVRRSRRRAKVHGGLRDDFWQKRRKAFGIVTLLEVGGCIIVVMLGTCSGDPIASP